MHSIQNLSRMTAALYLLMIPFGVMGILYVPNTLIVSGDIAATIQNIANNVSMFHISIFSSLVVQVIQIFLVLALYTLLRNVSKPAAVLMVALIIPAVSIAMLNEANYLLISALVSGGITLTEVTAANVQNVVGMLLHLHQAGVFIAQIFWGLWLFPMGYLVYCSGFIPRIIGVLLMIGCFGYLADSVLYILGIPVPFTVSEYTFLGEVLLPLWLLFKAKSVAEKYQTRFA